MLWLYALHTCCTVLAISPGACAAASSTVSNSFAVMLAHQGPDFSVLCLALQGFGMSDIDSDLLYCHQMMAHQHQQQQQHVPSASSAAVQGSPQHSQLQTMPSGENGGHGQPVLPAVKSEGNMDDLLNMFLRVSVSCPIPCGRMALCNCMCAFVPWHLCLGRGLL